MQDRQDAVRDALERAQLFLLLNDTLDCCNECLACAEREGRAVLHVLDGLVRRAAREDESLLCAWQAARLIRRGMAQRMAASPASIAA